MLQRKKYITMAAAAVLGLSHVAGAAIKLNEFSVNPPGADNGVEWFEIINTDGTAVSLDGLSVVNIEGDAGGGLGFADKVVPLAGHATGSNGLFLWRDSSTVIAPAPDAATVVHVEDFSPDWENPTGTFLLVSGFTGTQGDDLDTDDDGVLDVLPWTSVLDGFGFSDGGSTDKMYASQFGFADFPGAASGAAGAMEMYVRGPDGTQHGVGVTGDATNGYTVDDGNLPVGYQITPGNVNPPIPEPASVSVLALGGLAWLRRRDRSA